MKQRSVDYFERRKAMKLMQQPGKLREFLIAEYNSSRNIVVKKDIMKMIEDLDKLPAIEEIEN